MMNKFQQGFLDGFHSITPGVNPTIPSYAVPADGASTRSTSTSLSGSLSACAGA
jgi:hypothetical protein